MNSIRNLKVMVMLCAGIAMMPAQEQAPTSSRPFRDGDTVCFLGDSITKGGQYPAYLELFYATRYPDRRIRWFNCGVGGDRASAIVQAEPFRLGVDVLEHQPTVVTVMLGMNDVERSAYEKDGPASQLTRQAALDHYAASMRRIIAAVMKTGAQVVLITPSIYDETAQVPGKPAVRGVNGALGTCADMMRGWARQDGLGLADAHRLMNALNLQEQARDPAYSLIGAGKDWFDRVHPGPVGDLVLADAIIEAQGLDGMVSGLHIDAAQKLVLAADRCLVTGLTATTKGIAFDQLAQSLPFVPWPDSRAAMKLLPALKSLDREMLVVSGLDDGAYALTIDGGMIGTFTAQQFSAGVDLAGMASTPQFRQAERAIVISQQRWRLGEQLRELATFRYGIAKQGGDPMDSVEVAQAVEAEIAKAVAHDGKVPGYLQVDHEILADLAGNAQRYEALTEALRSACHPERRHYQLERTP